MSEILALQELPEAAHGLEVQMISTLSFVACGGDPSAYTTYLC